MSAETPRPMVKVRSCGVILFRRQERLEFLLMRHRHRYDLPKGHMEEGETEHQAALREMHEETGIHPDSVTLDDQFRYQEVYYPLEPRYSTERVEKTLVIFLAWNHVATPIVLTEHQGFEWFPWAPPHNIQKFTVNPVLAAVEQHFLIRPPIL